VVDQTPADKRAELQDSLNFLTEGGPKTVPFGLWVDGDGVTHRLRIDERGGAAITIEYYDFGVPVEVTPPPADEIVSNEEFAKELEQHQGEWSCDNGDAGSRGSSSSGGDGSAHAGKGKSATQSPHAGAFGSQSRGSGDGTFVTICVDRTE
jgi:hypothetical protein